MTAGERKKGSGTPGDTSGTPGGNANGVGGDMSQSMLMEIFRAIPRIETKLEHLEDTLNSTKKKVDDLNSWKNRILGGAAVLVFLIGSTWAVAKGVSEYVHVTFGKEQPAPSAPLEPPRKAASAR